MDLGSWCPHGSRMAPGCQFFCLGSPRCIDCDAVEFALCICVHFIPRTDAGLCSYFFQQDQIRKAARGYWLWLILLAILIDIDQIRKPARGYWVWQESLYSGCFHSVKRGISFGVVETFCQERDIFRSCWDMTKRMSRQKSAKMLFANCSRLNAGALLVSQTSWLASPILTLSGMYLTEMESQTCGVWISKTI